MLFPKRNGCGSSTGGFCNRKNLHRRIVDSFYGRPVASCVLCGHGSKQPCAPSSLPTEHVERRRVRARITSQNAWRCQAVRVNVLNRPRGWVV